MFEAFPRYPRYRALRLTEPLTKGEDVFALQTALDEFANPGSYDGILGGQTSAAIKEVQAGFNLTRDGVAGPATWAEIVDAIARKARDKYGIARGLLYGQLRHESGLYGGNYSPQRPDGSYDAGVAQRNTSFTPPAQGFDVPASIDALAAWVKRHHTDFAGVEKRRRWGLAAGSWNAPAWSCYVANEEGASVDRSRTAKPPDAARKTWEAYIASCTAYM